MKRAASFLLALTAFVGVSMALAALSQQAGEVQAGEKFQVLCIDDQASGYGISAGRTMACR